LNSVVCEQRGQRIAFATSSVIPNVHKCSSHIQLARAVPLVPLPHFTHVRHG
jgi:hypothetical protein